MAFLLVILYFTTTLFLLLQYGVYAALITVPSPPPSGSHIVGQNFLGISLELSFLDEYFGNDATRIPSAALNYLKAVRARTGNNTLRMRIGGNSMDSSIYNPSMTSTMMQMIPNASNSNNQPVNYGPVLWDVLNNVSSNIGGSSYLIGLSLLDPNSTDVPLLAGDASTRLSENLDGFLLGNEPDLYTNHQQRTNILNYTTAIYMSEFQEVLDHIGNTSEGNVLNKHDIGGPTICCEWNLDALLDDGYVRMFGPDLKYISLQHYPQDICSGKYPFGISYYIQHINVVHLAEWQSSGIVKALANNQQKVIMSEFNSAACGGVPTVSDSFAVGALWTIDYALQLASVGYSAAYIHTRERGVSYNLFSSSSGPNGAQGPWVTGSPYYGLLATAETLRSGNDGSIVVDLDLENSRTNPNATVSGYAIYDAKNQSLNQLVLFNYANTSSSANSSVPFSITATTFPRNFGGAVTVKYLTADSLAETTNIGWGGQTLASSTDGTLIDVNSTWAKPNIKVDCANGCTIDVPSPGMALVLADGPPILAPLPSNQTNQTNHTNNGPTSDDRRSASMFSLGFYIILVGFLYIMSVACLDAVNI